MGNQIGHASLIFLVQRAVALDAQAHQPVLSVPERTGILQRHVGLPA